MMDKLHCSMCVLISGLLWVGHAIIASLHLFPIHLERALISEAATQLGVSIFSLFVMSALFVLAWKHMHENQRILILDGHDLRLKDLVSKEALVAFLKRENLEFDCFKKNGTDGLPYGLALLQKLARENLKEVELKKILVAILPFYPLQFAVDSTGKWFSDWEKVAKLALLVDDIGTRKLLNEKAQALFLFGNAEEGVRIFRFLEAMGRKGIMPEWGSNRAPEAV